MDALCAAAPLARLLLALSEGRSSGVLRVRSGRRRAELCVARGKAVSLVGVEGELLGDTLLRRGDLDRDRHGLALAAGRQTTPVGRWLVEVGAASQAAVTQALSAQLEQRVRALLRFDQPELSFEPAPSVAALSGDADVDLASCVWDAMLEMSRELTDARRMLRAGRRRLYLTRTGSQLQSLLVHERRMPSELLQRCLCEGSALHDERVVLRALGAAQEHAPDADAYSLLLRKQRQIRRHAPPHTLLDLPASAAAIDARRALRRLARRLHPDRFDTDAPALRTLSSEVMLALVRAEESLRVRAPFARSGSGI